MGRMDGPQASPAGAGTASCEPRWKKSTSSRKRGGGFRALGVRCKNVDIIARRGVISNAGAFNTFQRLLAHCSEAAKPNLEKLEQLGVMKPSVQLVYLFVGLDGTDQELELPAANFWLLNGWDHDAQWSKFEKAATFEEAGFLPAVFLSFGSAKDDTFSTRRPGKATLQLLAPVRFEWFEKWDGTKIKNRGGDYDAEKELWKERLLERLYKHFPQTKGHVVVTEIATPLTTNFYLNTVKGESYGLSHTMPRFSLEAQEALHTATAVEGLTMTGQDAFSVGIHGALASGYLTAGYLSKQALGNAVLEAVVGPTAPPKSASASSSKAKKVA